MLAAGRIRRRVARRMFSGVGATSTPLMYHVRLAREKKWGFNIKSTGDAPMCRVAVSTVTMNSAAYRAGVIPGDILAEIEGAGGE